MPYRCLAARAMAENCVQWHSCSIEVLILHCKGLSGAEVVLCDGASPWSCHATCFWKSLFLLDKITGNFSTHIALSVSLLEDTRVQAACVNDQISHESGLKHMEMLNCGCGVGILCTLRVQIPVSDTSLYLAPVHHHADSSF